MPVLMGGRVCHKALGVLRDFLHDGTASVFLCGHRSIHASCAYDQWPEA